MARINPTKARPAAQPTDAGTMQLSTAEKALCARLVRVRRSERYWLRYFIEHLLHMDATSTEDVTTKQAADALVIMDNFTRWQTYFTGASQTCAALKDFPGLDWYPWDREGEDVQSVTAEVSATFTQKEQLEAELKELRALIESPRGSFRPQAEEYAARLRKALDRMAEEDLEG